VLLLIAEPCVLERWVWLNVGRDKHYIPRVKADGRMNNLFPDVYFLEMMCGGSLRSTVATLFVSPRSLKVVGREWDKVIGYGC
jgi:hypothetical protein